MPYRVIQWATGELGAEAVAGIAGHPDLELVGAWVHSADKEGRDVGELCGLASLGVAATRDKDALLALPADCVSYMPGRSWTKDPEGTLAELARILRSGKNVVNAAWPSLVYPRGISAAVHDTLQEACLAGQTSFYTSGVDPGYGSAGLALTALNVTREVRSIHTYEVLNDAHWDHPDFCVFFGFGQTDISSVPVLQPRVARSYFESTVHFLADTVGLELDHIEEGHSVIYAEESFDIPAAHIAAGTISGMRFHVAGMVGDEPRVVVEHVTRLRDEDYAELGFRGDGYRAEIDGEPCVRLDMALSSHQGNPLHAVYVACAMAPVNTIPQVCEAPPGVLTIADLKPYPSKNLTP